MMEAERRLFNRISFPARAQLHQGHYSWESPLIDISLKGIGVRVADPSEFNRSKPARGVIYLANDTIIQMTLRCARAEGNQLGFYCENIDVDSIGHLRRLVELNTGDPVASERELAKLAAR